MYEANLLIWCVPICYELKINLFTTAEFIKADISSNAVAHLQGKNYIKLQSKYHKLRYHEYENK